MKRIKIIPILALMTLLSSCGNNVEVKAPAFDGNGDEVTYSVFQEKHNALVTGDNIYVKNSERPGDRSSTTKRSSSSVTTETRGGKEISRQEEKDAVTVNLQFDYEANVAKVETTEKEQMILKSPEGDGLINVAAKREEYYQKQTIEGEEKLVKVNKTLKEYETLGSLLSPVTFDSIVNNDFANAYTSYFISYFPEESEVTADYKFYNYQNSRITYSYKVVENDTSDNYTLKETATVKAQLEGQKDKVSIKFSLETVEERTYTNATSSNAKGDIYKREKKQYLECEYKVGNYSLKAVDTKDCFLTD